MAADQAARQHAVGGDADAKLAAGRQDLVLDAARDQRIFDLQIADRMHGGGAPDRLRADFGQGRCAAHSRPSPCRRWRRSCLRSARSDRGAPAGRCRCGRRRAAAANRRGSSSPPRAARRSRDQPPAGSRSAPNFTLSRHLSRAHALQRLADQHFIVAHAVEIAGVEERDAGVERGMDGGDALARSAGPYMPDMPMQPRPRAETVGPVCAELTRYCMCSPP